MAKKLLTPEMENWLYSNYRDKSNQELAEKLTAWIKKENASALKEYKKTLQYMTYAQSRQEIEKRIKSIEEFNGVSPIYVMHCAMRLNCPQKSRTHISMSNREKARNTNMKKWRQKAMKVERFSEFIRTMQLREVRICIVENENQANSYRTAIGVFNQNEGMEQGLFLSAEHYKAEKLMRLEMRVDRSTN